METSKCSVAKLENVLEGVRERERERGGEREGERERDRDRDRERQRDVLGRWAAPLRLALSGAARCVVSPPLARVSSVVSPLAPPCPPPSAAWYAWPGRRRRAP